MCLKSSMTSVPMSISVKCSRAVTLTWCFKFSSRIVTIRLSLKICAVVLGQSFPVRCSCGDTNCKLSTWYSDRACLLRRANHLRWLQSLYMSFRQQPQRSYLTVCALSCTTAVRPYHWETFVRSNHWEAFELQRIYLCTMTVWWRSLILA